MGRCELAWAAGFFDGEGWAAAARQGRGDKRRAQARVNQADPRGVPAALIRFQAALGGLGRIGGPHRETGRIDLYRWDVSSRGDVERLQELLAPWLGQVKLAQLAAALGQRVLRSTSAERTKAWRAWAAGLYDGEGSLCLLAHRSHEGYRLPEMSVTQLAEHATPEVLVRFIKIVGRGRVYGPYVQAGAHAAVYRWKSGARGDIDEVLTVLGPWLGPVKRQQAGEALAVIRAQPVLPRGRPEWGSHKTYCIYGHEYSKTRLRPFLPRNAGKQRRDSEQCLQCARDQARAHRKTGRETGGRC